MRLSLAAALLYSCSALAQDLTFFVGENPPFNSIVNGKPQGLSVDIVTEMLQRASLSADYPIGHSWSRAFNLAQTKKNHCILSLSRIAEREDKFIWIGPITTNEWVFFGLRNKQIKLTQLNDARKYSIAGQLRDAKTTWLKSQGFQIDYAINSKQSIMKVRAGRADLIPSSVPTFQNVALSNGLNVSDFEPLFVFHRVDYYLGCSKLTEGILIQLLRKALESMRQDGKFSSILQSHVRTPPPL